MPPRQDNSPTIPPASNAQITLGQVRFTILSPCCVRMEYSPACSFFNQPTLFAINRSSCWTGSKITQSDEILMIDTGVLRLEYRPDGTTFSARNLRVFFTHEGQEVEWTPDSKQTRNLGGPVPTLDEWSGPRELPDGLLSRDGWYLLDDSGQPLLIDGWINQRPGGTSQSLDWYLFAYGSNYKSALHALSIISGKVPIPRRHILGSWYGRWHPYATEQFREIVAEYKEHDFPLDILVMDMDWHTQANAQYGFGHANNLGWTGYTWNKELIPEPEQLLKELKDDGIFVTLNDHPCDGMREHEEHYGDFIKRFPGCTRPNPPFNAGDPNYMDAFFKTAHEPLEKQGVDFWWLDWQQNYIYPSVFGVPGLLHLPWLNHLYFRDSAKEGRRGLSFSRWGGWGDHRHPIHFSGDTTSTWEMLTFQVPFTAILGNSGCFFWAHDLGGFCGDRNPGMFTRWVQFGALSPALRLHSCGDNLDRRPWLWSEPFETAMRSAFHLRAALLPYIYTSVRQCHDAMLPLLRPMYLEYPEQEEAYQCPQQYLFGDTLLAAPITSPGTGPQMSAEQKVWFPKGSWFNLLSHEKFEGGQTKTIQAEIDEIPVFVKAGVPIPLQPYTQRMTTAPLSTLIIRCYPGESGEFTLYEDDGQTQDYQHGKYATTALNYRRSTNLVTVNIGAIQGTYTGQQQERAYDIELPCTARASEAMCNGRPIAVEYHQHSCMNIVHVPPQRISTPIEFTLKISDTTLCINP